MCVPLCAPIDAPMHFVATGAAIDQVPLDALIGTARVIDIPDSVQAIDAGELNGHDWRGAQRVLFRTRSTLRGWMDSFAFHRDFAYVAPDAAQLLADAGVVLVGVDYIDRKSTRLNSSHLVISYAVFCLKKKKIVS